MDADMREFLVRVDSVCSLAAYRGMDDETRRELIAVSLLARSMVGGEDAGQAVPH